MTRSRFSVLDRRAALLGGAAALAAAPAQAQVDDLIKRLPKIPGMPGGKAEAKPAAPPIRPGVQTVEPRGYSQQFGPVREMIGQGRYADAMGRFAPPSAKAEAARADARGKESDEADDAPPPAQIANEVYLSQVELGLMAFEAGDPEAAIKHLRQAEDADRSRRDARGVGGAINKTVDAARYLGGAFIGQRGATTRYGPLDHERVLQLNYLALSHLLMGDRRCYNITRRCIAEQAELKARFDDEIVEYRAKYAQQRGDARVSDADRLALDSLAAQFQGGAEAERVPNAYVNPLGDYLAGVIQEIASREQPALRDNARIAYDSAGKLSGGSPQMVAAAKAMQRPRAPANERVLHVIVGEGFSPQREVMAFGLSLRGQVVPVRLPVFKPVGTPISRVAVLDGKGQTLVKLDPVGDVGAIRLRDQRENTALIMLSVLADSVGSILFGKAVGKLPGMFNALGQRGVQEREARATPDTRSWLSLPRRFHVARVVVPASVRKVQIVAFDAAGNRLPATGTADLSATDMQSMLYARVTPGAVRVQTARRLWIDGRLEEETRA